LGGGLSKIELQIEFAIEEEKDMCRSWRLTDGTFEQKESDKKSL
jgi:hypothetical protein